VHISYIVSIRVSSKSRYYFNLLLYLLFNLYKEEPMPIESKLSIPKTLTWYELSIPKTLTWYESYAFRY